MRLLAQPKVLSRAGLAAVLTATACYPQLSSWQQRLYPVDLLLLMVFCTTFVLWAFVFAWHFEYSHRLVMGLEFRPKLWVAATVWGVLWAAMLHWVLDPRIKGYAPNEYPGEFKSWVDTTLFDVSLTTLFLWFAPFAFFIRLFRKQEVATALTVIFGLFVYYLKWQPASNLPPAGLVFLMMLLRVFTGFLTLYFYLEGGAVLIWWLTFIMKCRLLLDFTGPK